jgi:RNA polymerase sigma-70 factor (ECF subfamily)
VTPNPDETPPRGGQAAPPAARQALETALREEGDRLYGLALRVTRNPDLAADAVHDGFASAIEAIDGFRGESALSTWLYRIVFRKAIDLLRKRGREEPLSDEDAEAGRPDEVPGRGSAWSRPPDELLFDRESRQALEEALATLPAVQRAAFELREVEQRPTEEVAEILNLPPATVRVYLHRARLKLRTALGPHFREAASS